MSLTLSRQNIKSYNNQRPRTSTNMLCWAPFRSMYIGFRGNISVCCFNKTHVIGKYPEQSLKETWFGEKAEAIRRAIINEDFSMGCHGCHELITANNYKNLPAKNFDFLKTDRKGYPTKIDFELSNECNLECIMCRGEFSSAIRRNREKLPPILSPYDQTFLLQLEEFIPHIESSHFLGGEPFMVPIYLEIWERMTVMNPSAKISIQTNGTVLSERVKKILNSMRFDIAVSIDSFNKENYEKIRINAVFEKVMENINYFREYCNIKNTTFSVSYCPMPQNWSELPDVIRICNQLKAKVFFNTVYFPNECSFTSLSLEELEHIANELSKTVLPSSSALEKYNMQCFKGIINQLNFWKNEARQKAANLKPVSITTISLYFNALENYILKNKEINEHEKLELFKNIKEKLVYIIEEAAKYDLHEKAEQHLLEVDFKTLCNALANVDKEHALYLFKSFMIPFPE